mgnify:FL=1
MNEMAAVPGVLGIASALWAAIAGFRMGARLSARGVKINWLLYRATMPWYVHRYRKMTTELEGRPGPLFGQFLVAIALSLSFGLATIVVILAGRA